jgi:FkbM family methyltransferase
MTRKRLYSEVSAKGLCIKKVAEIGVFYPQASNIADFIKDGVQCLLVEPDPVSIEKIEVAFGHLKNVTLFRFAIADENGTLELVQRGASTFARNLPRSPSLVNENYKIKLEDVFLAEARRFDRIDPGDIDLISLDIEGGEWFVLKHMISRPQVISVETHGGRYSNYYLKEINKWMKINGYQKWYKDKSDTVYAFRDSVKVSFLEKLTLYRISLYIVSYRFYREIIRRLTAIRHGLTERERIRHVFQKYQLLKKSRFQEYAELKISPYKTYAPKFDWKAIY